MAVVDASAARLMQLSSELLEARDVIARQRRQLWALVAALRSERAASAALAELVDVLLAAEAGDG